MAGLAKQLRLATDNEDVDLGGYGESQISDLFTAAFKEPIVASKMIGFRFTVGGGKKVRQKYGEDMPKWCREALRAIGFEEDRGACAVMDCAGTFKYQHDTDKDLKFIHVFPKIDTAAAAAAAAPNAEEEDAVIKVAGMSLDELPPAHLCAIVSRETFSKLFSKQCPSFSQRRALLKALKELAARLTGFEERMTNMKPLTTAEEELYNTAQEVPEKVAELEKSLEGMMSGGHLTRAELDLMIKDLKEKEDQLQALIASAQAAGKKTEKQESGLAQLRDKISSLQGMEATVRKRKEDREILTLWKQLRDLRAIEDSKQLLSVAEIQKLNVKPQIEARLKQLEDETRGWFDEAVPEADRLKEPAAKPKPAAASSAGGAWSTTASKGSGGGGVVRPGGQTRSSSNPWAALG